MKCYARWIKDKENFYRDQTILQFGESWELIANIILLNPGSAVPKSDDSVDDFLASKNLPYFVKSDHNQNYYEFTIDPLMRNIINCFKNKQDAGVIKIYNLFNLKNQDSKKALLEYQQNIDNPYIHTEKKDILYDNKKVIIATGESNLADTLKLELKKYIQLADNNNLYALQKIAKQTYTFKDSTVNKDGLIGSFHPSYTFGYGNATLCN
jgi:hypothetical protein